MATELSVLYPMHAIAWMAKWKHWTEWERESYPQTGDLILIPVFALLFPTVRFFLDFFLFERWGKRLIYGPSGPLMKGHSKADNDAVRRRLTKFNESAWKCAYYLSAEIFTLVITYNEPWFTDTKQFWIGPEQQRWPDQKAKLKLKVLYGFSGGFYVYSIFALVFWETRRSDFGVSMSHHVTSIILIVFSYLNRFYRVGSVVLAIHDGSDVFLEIAKLTKYTGFEILPSIFFLLFAISWVILRLIYFPLYIIWSTSFYINLYGYEDSKDNNDFWNTPAFRTSLNMRDSTSVNSYEVLQLLDKSDWWASRLYYLFNVLLISLLVMHVYWWVLIYRMILKQVQALGRVSDDVRSDSEHED